MYYLSKVISDKEYIEYKPLCRLSKDQYSIIIQSEKPLYNILMLKSLYQMFSKNTDELLSGIEIIVNEYKIREEIIPYMPDISKIELNRLLFNCLFSFRTFIDHSESFVKKYYGKNSKQSVEYHNTISSIYDNNFEYRFVYKLRNFAQHCGLPLNHFSTKYYRNYEHVSVEVMIKFNIDDMLKDYDSWGQVKNELVSLKEDLSVAETMEKFRNILKDVLLWLSSLYDVTSATIKQLTADLLNNGNKYDELAITYTNKDNELYVINSVFRYMHQIETM